MKKTFLNISILLFIVLGLLYFYNAYLFAIDEDTHGYADEIKRIETANVISMGNSEGLRLKLGALNRDKIADLCLVGSDIFTAKETFDVVASHISQSQIVFLNVSNTSLYSDTKAATDSNQLSALDIHAQMLYYCMPFSYVTQKDVIRYFRSRFYLVNSVQGTEKAFSSFAKIILPKSMYKKIKSTGEKSEEEMERAPTKGIFDKKAFSQKNQIVNSVAYYPMVHQKAVEALEEIKYLANQHHIVLIAYSCPHTRRFIELFGKEMFDSTSDNIRKTMKILDIPYFDHFYDEDFVDKEACFYDCAHLNKTGAQKFDNKLFKEVLMAFPQYSEFFKGMIR